MVGPSCDPAREKLGRAFAVAEQGEKVGCRGVLDFVSCVGGGVSGWLGISEKS